MIQEKNILAEVWLTWLLKWANQGVYNVLIKINSEEACVSMM